MIMPPNKRISLPNVSTSPCSCPICCNEEWGDFREDQCLLNKRITRITKWYKEAKKVKNWYKTTMEQIAETEEGREFLQNLKKENEEKEKLRQLELECKKIDPTKCNSKGSNSKST